MPDYGPRIRAARGWADISQKELADALERDQQFVLRRELPPKHERHQPATRGDLLAIASVCGVPPGFLLEGFGGLAPSEISQRLADLEELLQEMRREQAVLDVEEHQRNDEVDEPGEDSQSGPPP